MEIIFKKVGETIGDKVKETISEKKRLITLILCVAGAVLLTFAIILIVVNLLNKKRKPVIEILDEEDTDGDGESDVYAVDTDGDGKADSFYLDTDGNGAVDTILSDTDGDGEPDTVFEA